MAVRPPTDPTDPGRRDRDTHSGPVPSQSGQTIAVFRAVGRPTFEVPPDLRRHPRYEVLDLLGAGGMATVYAARHRLMDRVVALKVVRPHLVTTPGMVDRFRREVRAAASLDHPNIVPAYDADQAGDTHFPVMKFVAGVPLDRVVADRGPLPVAEACGYAADDPDRAVAAATAVARASG